MNKSLHFFVRLLVIGACVWPSSGADTPPVSKIDFLQPTEGQNLQGTVEVRIRITPPEGQPMPQQVYVGLGGPPWAPLKLTSAATDWVGRLDSTLVPNGEQTLKVVTDERGARAALRVSVENPLQCYFGESHSHTSYSDGTVLPAVAHAYARNVAKLDYFILTEHLESLDEEEWRDIREQVWKANHDGSFLAIPGLEWTKEQGHACIFDPLTLRWPSDLAGLYRAAAEAGVVLKFNHPGEGTNVFNGLAYSAEGDQAVQLIEVRQEIEERAYLQALEHGWHVAPDGADDTHQANWGMNRTWTGIWAPALSSRNIWAALKRRNCFSTQDRNCQFFFSVNGEPMGEILSEPVSFVEILVHLHDPDSGDRIERMELFEDGVLVLGRAPKLATLEWEPGRRPPVGPHYYFVKVTQADGDLLWSAPVWVSVSED